MKKVIPTTWLKAITTLYFLMIIIFTSSAQQGNWEIGIGLRPLNLKYEPYSLNAKWHFNNRFALRFGLGAIYNEQDEFNSYQYFYYRISDTTHKFAYEYTQVEKNFYANFFVGIQYWVTRKLSIALESGAYYTKVFSRVQKYTYEIGRTEPPNEDATLFGFNQYLLQKQKLSMGN